MKIAHFVLILLFPVKAMLILNLLYIYLTILGEIKFLYAAVKK